MTNTHISALPNEVLVEIFTKLKDNSFLKTWQELTAVCRHWRAVALEAASLWTRPPAAHHEYTLLMLERSRQSPLEVTLHSRTPKATSIAILSHIARISTLTICDQPMEHLDEFQATLLRMGQKASQLRSLHIHNKGWSMRQLSATTFLEPTSLKSLRLTCIDFEWGMLPIRSLTVLSLTHLRISQAPSWVQLLNALHKMPSLEELRFGFSDLRLHSRPINSESFEMPCLRRLEITSGRSSEIETFLLSMTFPRLQQAHVQCWSNDGNDLNDYSAVINASLLLITGGDFGHLDHIELATNRFKMSQLSPSDGKSRRSLEFVRSYITYGRLAQDAMAGISALPGDRTSDFVVVVFHAKLTSQNFKDLLGGLPRLKSLRAYACSGVIGSLRIRPLRASDLPIPFPNLQMITLDKVGSLYDDCFPFLEELRHSLMLRREYGFGVKKLRLNWELTEQEAQVLQETVVELDFWGFANLCRTMVERVPPECEGNDNEFEEHWIVNDD